MEPCLPDRQAGARQASRKPGTIGSMLKVGLTGGIASGKTTVAEMFSARSCRVFSADRIAHELIARGQPAYEELVRTFGREIVGPDGAIDRQRLAATVFTDPSRREQLNRIVHPQVITEIEKQFTRLARAEPRAVALLEAALLVESGYHRRLDKLVVTWCRPEQQVERLMKQAGLSRTQAEQRVAAQFSSEEKRRHADYAIDCSRSLEATEAQVEKIWQELRQLAEGAPTG